MKSFDEWAADRGHDISALSENLRADLLAAWKTTVAPGDDPRPPPKPEERLEAMFAKHRAEEERKGGIAELAARFVQQDRDDGIAPRIGQVQEMAKIAIDAGWQPEKFELNWVRMSRPRAPAPSAGRGPQLTDDVVEAAVCHNAGLAEREKYYKPEVLEAARQQFPRGMSLGDLVMHYARRGGYTGHSLRANPEAAWKAARKAHDIQAAGSWGPSTQGASIGTMLANIANKFFRAAFENVEQSWRQIAAIRPVNDFKLVTTWSLTGDLTFKKVPPGGEIQHGQVDGTSYTNQVDTYARMLGIDRRDIINDDISAFSSVARRLGRGGGIAFNKLFWGVFLNNSSFFTAGRNNLITGGGTTLQLSQLDALNQKIRLQTDPDGNILGGQAAILLVPPALEATANTLMSSTLVVSGATTTPGTPNANPWANKWRVVSSAYMQDATLTGNSSTAWYLLFDPNDLPVIEAAFLNGQQTPTVEESDSDFGMLGQAFRGFFDVGVALQEYRAGAKSAGA